MQFAYGEQLPLRLLDEANFWKHQEQEHTVVIREITPDLERKFAEELREWEAVFARTLGKVVQLTETIGRLGQPVNMVLADQVQRLISFCLEQSCRFVQFLFHLLNTSPAVKQSLASQTVVKHIIRESEYFIGIAQTICAQS